MITVFVTFTFGAIIPLLFPIAYAALLVFYTVERLMIAYSYQKPPHFNSKPNRVMLWILKLAPVIYCLNGAWAYSN